MTAGYFVWLVRTHVTLSKGIYFFMFREGKLVSRQERWNHVGVTSGGRIGFIYILSDLLMDELDDTFILIIQKDSWLRLESKALLGN